jgi:hypothetical protein
MSDAVDMIWMHYTMKTTETAICRFRASSRSEEYAGTSRACTLHVGKSVGRGAQKLSKGVPVGISSLAPRPSRPRLTIHAHV